MSRHAGWSLSFLIASAAILAAFVVQGIYDAAVGGWWGSAWYLVATAVGVGVLRHNWDMWQRAKRTSLKSS